MDWRMPGMDGVEAMRRLEGEQLKHTPTVIMVTAYGREEALGAAQHSGVRPRAVLTKPVTPSTLLEAVAEALGRQGLIETRALAKADTHAQAVEQLAGARLLLVEDNDLNQELATDLLTDAGIEVRCAGNGQEALELLAEDARFDGVLMDCQMPVMDGYTATERIRANPAWNHIPVIAMTANAMAGDREKALSVGMCDHVPKPLDVDSMFMTLARWVKPAARRAPPARAAKPAAGLPPLPGIDTAQGLATAGGKLELYRRLLLKFHAGQQGFAEDYAAARTDAADPQAAQRIAHTLKGTAGNIGAHALEKAAGRLEQCSAPGYADASAIEAALADVLTQLAPVLAGLAELSSPPAPPQPQAPAGARAPDPGAEARLRQGLARLSRLLAEGDADAVEFADELLAQATEPQLVHVLRRVTRALSDFDFDRAVEALREVEATP
jgi:CheY-like chemotaxis protein